MLAANIKDVKVGLTNPTTYYDDRVYYSYVLEPSSFAINRFLNISLGDAESISGMTSKRGSTIGTNIVEIYKQSSIFSLSFTILDPVGEGGTQQITKIAEGFGNITESPPENIGAWDIMFSKDGILQWDGGMLFRANLDAEKVLISRRIKNITDKLISRNSYKNAILKYYPKNNWLIFAYEDPDLSPKGTPNSVMIYDILTGEWWPQKNWVVGSLEVDRGPNGRGILHYGDGMDGYVHVVDDPIDSDDSRKEISLDAMEKTDQWFNAGISTTVVAVGTASLTLTLTPTVNTSSISRVFVMPMGEWYDKSISSNTDLLSFKINPSSVGYLKDFRIDLEVNDVQNRFDTNFSSIVISSASLTAGSSAWTTIEITLSSFPIASNWIDLAIEDLPFARNSTRFGIRFVATATADLTLYFDDIRLVQRTKNPLNPFRSSKQFNLGVLSNKDFHQVVLGREKQRDSGFNIDVFTGIGEFANTVTIDREIPQEIFVCGYNGSTGITKLSSVDLKPLQSTQTVDYDFQNGGADNNSIFAFDTLNERMVKFDRSQFGVVTATFGSFGSGTSNYNFVQEVAVESNSDGNILLMDHMNHRVKMETKEDFTFVKEYGQLGLNATSFYNPTGLDFDNLSIYVGDDTNQRITKFSLDNFSVQGQANLDINTVGNLSVRCDEKYCYDAYNRGSNLTPYFIDVVLEKRNKGDLSLINRISVLPKDIIVSSTYSLRGSIALHSKYVFISFNDNSSDAGTFYLQKRLQSDFSLVTEFSTTKRQYGVIGDGLSRESKQKSEKISLGVLQSPFIQLKFYQKDQLDSSFKLNSMAFVAEKLSYTK